MYSPKEQHQKKNRTNDVCASRNTLKTPPQTIFKKGGGGFKNPHGIGFLRKNPAPLTPAASGIPSASERGAKSEVAHKWARWLHHPCRLGDPHRLRAGGKIRSGP